MPAFNFASFTASNILNELLNTIPISVTSYNFLIVGNSLIIPLGDKPKNTYSSKIAYKDKASSEISASSTTETTIQDGSTVISQRQGNQIRVSAQMSIKFFSNLFSFTNDLITVPIAGVVDFAFNFAYQNFINTRCILVDGAGIRGAGSQILKLQDFNRTLDPNDPDKLILDLQLYYEEEKEDENVLSSYEVDQNAIDSALA